MESLFITGKIVKIEKNKYYLQLDTGKIIIGQGKPNIKLTLGDTFTFWA